MSCSRCWASQTRLQPRRPLPVLLFNPTNLQRMFPKVVSSANRKHVIMGGVRLSDMSLLARLFFIFCLLYLFHVCSVVVDSWFGGPYFGVQLLLKHPIPRGPQEVSSPELVPMGCWQST